MTTGYERILEQLKLEKVKTVEDEDSYKQNRQAISFFLGRTTGIRDAIDIVKQFMDGDET